MRPYGSGYGNWWAHAMYCHGHFGSLAPHLLHSNKYILAIGNTILLSGPRPSQCQIGSWYSGKIVVFRYGGRVCTWTRIGILSHIWGRKHAGC